MIYDYIFYNAYKLNKKSGNFKDTPILSGLIWLLPIWVFNFFTLFFIVQGVMTKKVIPGASFKYPFAIIVVIIGYFYYKHNDRYKRIIDKYDLKTITRSTKIPPFFVVISAFIISFLLSLVAGMYKNGDWIFKR